MSALPDFPNIRPSLLMDFANSRRTHPLLTCVRASSATRIGSDGKLKIVAANVPRIDFDPVTGKCLGLLVEEARTNSLVQSSNLASTPWNSGAETGYTCTPDSGVLPFKVDAGSSLQTAGGWRQTIAPTAGAWTLTVQCSKGSSDSTRIGITQGADFSNILISFAAGTLAVTSAASIPITRTSIRKIDAVVFEISMTITVTSTSSITPRLYAGATGATVGGHCFYGYPQLELGGFPTSYIPTTSVAATRAADNINLDIKLPIVGTIITGIAALASGNTANAYLWSAINPEDTNADHAYSYCSGASSTTNWWVNKGGVGQSGGSIAVRAINSGFTYSGSSKVAAIVSGGLITNDTSRPKDFPSTLSRIYLGRSRNSSATGYLNGCIARLAVYSGTVTNAQLQRLTTP